MSRVPAGAAGVPGGGAMIYCLIFREHTYTMRAYLRSWGQPVASQFAFIYWQDLPRWRTLPPGTYLFTDLERLSPQQMQLACHLADRLESAAAGGQPYRMVNDPRRLKRRYDLLLTLHEQGLNPFRPWRLDDLREGVQPRYPVFLRREDEHTGSLSPLLEDRASLERSIEQVTQAGEPRDRLIAVEYCEVADGEGCYGKYSVFRIGGIVFPWHYQVSSSWVNKMRTEDSPATREAEQVFVDTRPHDDQLRRYFEMAHIEYGRADYAVHEGRIILWEINTNPTLLLALDRVNEARLPLAARNFGFLNEGFAAMMLPPDELCQARRNLPLKLPPALAAGLGYTRPRRWRDGAMGTVRRGMRRFQHPLRRLTGTEPVPEGV